MSAVGEHRASASESPLAGCQCRARQRAGRASGCQRVARRFAPRSVSSSSAPTSSRRSSSTWRWPKARKRACGWAKCWSRWAWCRKTRSCRSSRAILGVPAVRLRDGMIDPIAVRLLPRRVAERLDAIALFKVRDTLCVAMADPQNLEQLDEIERITGLHVRPVFAFRSSIQRTLPRCYEEGFEVDTVTADLDESAVQLQADAAEVDLTNVESMVDGSPIINLVNYLLVQAIRAGASDIHIEPSRKFSVVRFRVDGQMYEALRPRRDMHPALVSRIKVMAKMDIAEHNRPQDGRFQVTVEGREVDFRVSTLPTVLGEKIVMRILDKENLTFNLDLLGFPPDMLKQLKATAGQAVRTDAGHRPDGQRQDDDAVFGAGADQERPQQRRVGRRPGRVPGRAGEPGAGRRVAAVVVQLGAAFDSAAGPGHHHDRRNPRRGRRRRSPCRRRSPGTWCSARCTRTTAPARSTGSWTWASSRSRSRRRWWAWWPSG